MSLVCNESNLPEIHKRKIVSMKPEIKLFLDLNKTQ